MRILVTGSRDWTDAQTVFDALEKAAYGAVEVTVVHGANARGADRIAADYAKARFWNVEPHPADWGRHKSAAGPIRNEEMVALGADVCLAFAMPCSKPTCAGRTPHDSHGTWHCAAKADEAGIPVVFHRVSREDT